MERMGFKPLMLNDLKAEIFVYSGIRYFSIFAVGFGAEQRTLQN